MTWSSLEGGSHPLGHEPCGGTILIRHHFWWEHLPLRLRRSKKGEKWARLDSNQQAEFLWAALRMCIRKTGDRVIYAILLEVESFNKRCFCMGPWGLICSVIVNEPFGAKLINLVDILQPSNQESIYAQSHRLASLHPVDLIQTSASQPSSCA